MTSFNDWGIHLVVLGSFVASACSAAGHGTDDGEQGEETASIQDELGCRESNVWDATPLGLLDPPPGIESGAWAINERGTVVGWSQRRFPPEVLAVHAFRWKRETGMVDLGTLGGTYSEARDVNERDEVAGVADFANERRHAVVWDAQNRIHDLGTLQGASSFALAMNNRGQVIGLSETSSANFRPFVWEEGTGMVEILPQNLTGVPVAINDAGTVVGTLEGYDHYPTPFKWTKEEGVTELDLLGTTAGAATAINDRGEIAGYVFVKHPLESGPEVLFPVVWTARGARRLPTVPNRTAARPTAINHWGVIVGEDITETEPAVAMRWDTSGRSPRLPSIGPSESIANDVNDRGDIVGAWTSGVRQATLWETREALPTSETMVAFRTSDGSHYLTAEADGGGSVSADRSVVRAWERFIISDLDGGALLSGDRIQIRHVSAEGESFWLTADINGGGPRSILRANRSLPQGWETFIIWQSGGGVITGGARVNLQATTRPFYVSAEQGGGRRGDGSVTVNRSVAKAWETFTLVATGARDVCPFTDTLCLFEDANFGGARYNVKALDPSAGVCIDLVAHGWGARARSAVNTNSRSARLFQNPDCTGGPIGVNALAPTLALSPNSAFVY